MKKITIKLALVTIASALIATSANAAIKAPHYTLNVTSTTSTAVPFTGSLMLLQKNGSRITRLDHVTPFSVSVNAYTVGVMLQDQGKDNIKVEVLDESKKVLLGGEGRAMFILQDADGSGTIVSK